MSADDLLAQALDAYQRADWLAGKEMCQTVLAAEPEHHAAHHLLGNLLSQLGEAEAALGHLEYASLLAPSHAQYRYNYAVTLAQAGYDEAAAVQYQACLRHDPDHCDALWNYGEVLRLDERFRLAKGCFERLLAMGQDYPGLHHRLAVTYAALNQPDAARESFERALQENCVDPLTHWEVALFELSQENFESGFRHYLQRFDADGRNNVHCQNFPYPRWRGEWQPGATLLIHGEQGLGDEMMFASIIPEVLRAADAAQMDVVLAVKPALVRLFAHSFPGARVVSHKTQEAPANLDTLGEMVWQAPMGDLPAYFRTSLDDFAGARRAYLAADPERVEWYRHYLDLQEPQGASPTMRVGLMWGSNPLQLDAKYVRWSGQRSIRAELLDRLASLRPHVRFVSLQNAERGAEASRAAELDILDLSALQTDFYETAALVANLDLVVSVDTSVSHLAGGMAHPCAVMLMHRADWRHGKSDRMQSYWYANTDYYRQQQPGDWLPVLDQIAGRIAAMLP